MKKDDICCKAMIEYSNTVDMLIEHEKSCDICIKFVNDGEKDIYRLTCVEGWTYRYNLRILAEKVEFPARFVE